MAVIGSINTFGVGDAKGALAPDASGPDLWGAPGLRPASLRAASGPPRGRLRAASGDASPPHAHPHPTRCLPAGWSSIDFLVQTLQGYGVPFDVLRIDAALAPPINVTALLTNADGSAKYAGLYIYPSLEAIGTLTRAQVTDLRAYQVASGARSVVFGAWVSPAQRRVF